MGYPRRMAAALPNNTVKNNGANVNQIQFGDKLQGLIGVTNRRVGVNRYVRTRCGGHLPGRATVFCVNQLGGVGNVKNSQFAPNADGVKDCKKGVYNGNYKGDYNEEWTLNLPTFASSVKLDVNQNQLSLLQSFEDYNYLDIQEEYNVVGNTEFAIISLRQEHFNDGTLQIRVPGVYVLRENITFHPNPDNNFMPTKEQMESGRYPAARNGGAYHLGFFAAIAIETDGVILDLNGMTIQQSREHSLMQRFYANIELANAPFIIDQGPGKFTTESTYKAAENVMIMNGTLGRSSHHGIHGNRMRDIVISNLDIRDFEVAGIALNGAINSVIMDVKIRNTTKDVPILSSFSQAVFLKPLLERVEESDPSLSLDGRSISEIIDALDSSIRDTRESVLSGNPIVSDLFRNDNRNTGYDGNVYGMVFNVNGVVINDFLQTRPDDAIGNTDIYASNIVIEDLLSKPIEIIGISKAAEQDIPPQEQAYGGKRQVGPAGDVLDIMRITDKETMKYKPNILSDGQLILAKYVNANDKKMGTINITKQVVEWAENTLSIAELLDDPWNLYYIKNGDSMGHLMKGNIGLFISGGRDIKMRGLVVNRVINMGVTDIYVPEKTGNKDKTYEGATSSGILLAASKGIDISGASVGGVISDKSNAFAVRKIGDSDNIKINNSLV